MLLLRPKKLIKFYLKGKIEISILHSSYTFLWYKHMYLKTFSCKKGVSLQTILHKKNVQIQQRLLESTDIIHLCWHFGFMLMIFSVTVLERQYLVVCFFENVFHILLVLHIVHVLHIFISCRSSLLLCWFFMRGSTTFTSLALVL